MMKRVFEKITFQQFRKDIENNVELYNSYVLPRRETKASAGYDFFSLDEIHIKPGERKKIPTGVKSKFKENEVLFLVVRSSMGFKYNVRLCNQVGVVDADYYNNKSNEGHIWVMLQNEGEDEYIIKKGDKFCQGIFIPYLVTDNEVKDFEERVSDY